MNRESVPDEDTQTETYRTIIEAMNGDPVSIRVLDWGGEKDIEALSSEGHRARRRGYQPGSERPRHPASAAPAEAVRDATRRHPARFDGRPDARACCR